MNRGKGERRKIQAKVTPNAKRPEVREEGSTFVVKVKEPPQEGKANAAVIKAIAQHLGVPVRAVRIVSGHTGKNKVVEVTKPD